MRNLTVSLCVVVVLAVLLESGLNIYHAVGGRRTTGRPDRPEAESLYVLLDSPVIYGLNPRHPGINSRGLRDREVDVPKPAGVVRVLILGDSVTFGTLVAREKTYPSRLERLLGERNGRAEVVNAGVNGYNAYNELQFYLTEGRKYDPDIVIVAFCMNDVVNPRLHWGSNMDAKIDLPLGAIPNREHDRLYAIPRIGRQGGMWRSLLGRSRLYEALSWRLRLLAYRLNRPETPTFITGNDTTSIRVLLDEHSPEFRWLVSIYSELKDAVESDGATLIAVLFPLAYQLDEGYPFFPQKLLSRFCADTGIQCIDMLESFREHGKDELFLLGSAGYDDVWHLSARGHEVAARALNEWLQANIESISK